MNLWFMSMPFLLYYVLLALYCTFLKAAVTLVSGYRLLKHAHTYTQLLASYFLRLMN